MKLKNLLLIGQIFHKYCLHKSQLGRGKLAKTRDKRKGTNQSSAM